MIRRSIWFICEIYLQDIHIAITLYFYIVNEVNDDVKGNWGRCSTRAVWCTIVKSSSRVVAIAISSATGRQRQCIVVQSLLVLKQYLSEITFYIEHFTYIHDIICIIKYKLIVRVNTHISMCRGGNFTVTLSCLFFKNDFVYPNNLHICIIVYLKNIA